MPLSAAGLTVPTGAEYLDDMAAAYEALTGLTLDQSRTDDQVTMIFLTVLAERLGGIAELIQAVYDGTSVDAAAGIQLEDAALLVGITPDPATYSQATVKLVGVTGTVIPEGSLVEGGGDDDDARWLTTSAVTLAGGTGSVVVQAQVAGPTEAAIGAIDKIVTGVSGWTAVENNVAAADPGEFREDDAAIRRRRRGSLQVDASSSTAAIKASLLELDYMQEVAVIQNASNVGATVSGKAMNANSIWVFQNPISLTDAQEDEVAALLHRKVPAGTEMMTDGGSTTKVVTDLGGSTGRDISWNPGSDVPTGITALLTLEPGYVLADLSPAITAAVTAHFNNNMGMGDPLRKYDLIAATAGIEGIAFLDYTASAVNIVTAPDYTHQPAIDETVTLTTVLVLI